MQTRTRSKQAALSSACAGQPLPTLPAALQHLILDHLLPSYSEPDSVEYTMWPYKSTLAWLLSLRLVNKQWGQYIAQHASCTGRCRLEALRNLSLLHDYAHYIVTSRCSKRERVKRVPRQLPLMFEDGSCTTFAVPKALTGPEKTSGLPSNTLMLVAPYGKLTLGAFKQLLSDIDCLDQRHSAPMVLKVTNTPSTTHRIEPPAPPPAAAAVDNQQVQAARGSQHVEHPGSSRESHCQAHHSVPGIDTCSSHATAAGEFPVPAALVTHHLDGQGSMRAPAGTKPPASSIEQLIAAAAPLLRHTLVHVVMEGSAASPALYFIPTKQGFCRRVKPSHEQGIAPAEDG